MIAFHRSSIYAFSCATHSLEFATMFGFTSQFILRSSSSRSSPHAPCGFFSCTHCARIHASPIAMLHTLFACTPHTTWNGPSSAPSRNRLYLFACWMIWFSFAFTFS